MELLKKNIHMDRIKTEAVSQFTLEDDVNIPESKPDVDALCMEKSEIIIEEIKAGTDMVNVRGKLAYSILYRTMESGRNLVTLEGKLAFDEKINLQGASPMDSVMVSGKVEDLNIGIINSRKLSIQSLLTLHAQIEELYDEELPVGISGEDSAEYRRMPTKLSQIAICKNDIFRMKEEISLPSNYPNIFQILWSNLSLRDIEFKVMDERIVLQGDVQVFVLYEGEGEEHPIRAFETTMPLNGVLDCYGCKEGMLPDIRYQIAQQEFSVKPDFDGEERNIGLELVMDIIIRIYEEEAVELLTDIYGVSKEVEAITHGTNLRCLLAHVTGKTKVTGHAPAAKGGPAILQLLHCEGQVSLDHQQTVENGIMLQGSLLVKVLYITGDDAVPYMSTQVVLPYEYTLDVPNIKAEDMGRIHAEVELLQVNMLDGEELDIKAILSFTTTVFQNIPVQLIGELKVSAIDTSKLGNLPGMVIYMVQPGDNLWNIGKKYYVPVDTLRELNGLGSDEIKAGQKLLIVKGNS
ncbi:MAG: DUF3794 domain-containing protein [Lachnospiraceae bacterium]|nr:DUF3794 domain-containing protein [Lachnospiraceae bacterium]